MSKKIILRKENDSQFQRKILTKTVTETPVVALPKQIEETIHKQSMKSSIRFVTNFQIENNLDSFLYDDNR